MEGESGWLSLLYFNHGLPVSQRRRVPAPPPVFGAGRDMDGAVRIVPRWRP